MKKLSMFILSLCSVLLLLTSFPSYVFADTTDAANLSEVSITLPRERYGYTGEPIEPLPTVERGVNPWHNKLVEGKDFELEYENNINVGTATVVVKGIGAYCGERSVEFSIVDEGLRIISADVSPRVASSWITQSFSMNVEAEKAIGSIYLTYMENDNPSSTATVVLYPNGGNRYSNKQTYIELGKGNIGYLYGKYTLTDITFYFEDGSSLSAINSNVTRDSFAYDYLMDLSYLDFTLTPRSEEVAPMYRLYNPNSGEHFYTSDEEELDAVTAAGWQYEGVGWVAPLTSDLPVYRLYSGTDHHYTMDEKERDYLVSVGWSYEGIGWYSYSTDGVPLLRQFNPYVDPSAERNNSGSHNFTISKEENDNLVNLGWKEEGIAWYGSPII